MLFYIIDHNALDIKRVTEYSFSLKICSGRFFCKNVIQGVFITTIFLIIEQIFTVVNKDR